METLCTIYTTFCRSKITSKWKGFGSSWCGSVVMNPASVHEDAGLIPGLTCWVKNPLLSWAVVYVGDAAWMDLALPWLWYGPAAAALIWPLTWDFHMPWVQFWKDHKKYMNMTVFEKCRGAIHIGFIRVVSSGMWLYTLVLVGINYHQEALLWISIKWR